MIRKLLVVSACVLLAACANNRATIPDRVALPPPPPAGERWTSVRTPSAAASTPSSS